VSAKDYTPKLPDLIFVLPKIGYLSGNKEVNVSLLNVLGEVFFRLVA